MALFWLSLLGKGYKGGKLKRKLKYLSMKVNHVTKRKMEAYYIHLLLKDLLILLILLKVAGVLTSSPLLLFRL